MLITTEDLRARFGISSDVQQAKLTNAIWEAENIDMRNCFGAELVKRFNEDSQFFETYAHETHSHGGLVNALMYLAYSRYLITASATNTAAGTKIQQLINSNDVDFRDRNYQIEQNKNIGHSILNQIKEQIGASCQSSCKPFKLYN